MSEKPLPHAHDLDPGLSPDYILFHRSHFAIFPLHIYPCCRKTTKNITTKRLTVMKRKIDTLPVVRNVDNANQNHSSEKRRQRERAESPRDEDRLFVTLTRRIHIVTLTANKRSLRARSTSVRTAASTKATRIRHKNSQATSRKPSTSHSSLHFLLGLLPHPLPTPSLPERLRATSQ